MDYSSWHPRPAERVRYGIEAALLTALIALCFYNSPWGLVLYPAVLFWHLGQRREQQIRRRQSVLRLEFRDAVQAIAAALAAGYSPENAIREARRDLQLMNGSDTDMVQELAAIQRRLDSHQTIEEAFQDLAARSALPEVQTFAEIFAVGKRSGGDLIAIMKDTAQTIAQTVETERQVASVLASRRYEQRIMNVIPFGMLLYLRVASPGFMDPVYGNMVGVAAMSGCLGLYVGAWYLGKRMLEIEV